MALWAATRHHTFVRRRGVWGCVPAATDLGLAGAMTPHSVQVEAAIGPAPGHLGVAGGGDGGCIYGDDDVAST
jgi:hypothetical protein